MSEELQQRLGPRSQFFARIQRHEAVFRFLLVDAAARTFQAQRFCYRGAIDDWIMVGSEGTLKELAKEFLPHIGSDSYFDLF